LTESTVPSKGISVQFLFKSTQHTWRYERKCKWVFIFWTQCTLLYCQLRTTVLKVEFSQFTWVMLLLMWH